jgi:hypothetical protein
MSPEKGSGEPKKKKEPTFDELLVSMRLIGRTSDPELSLARTGRGMEGRRDRSHRGKDTSCERWPDQQLVQVGESNQISGVNRSQAQNECLLVQESRPDAWRFVVTCQEPKPCQEERHIVNYHSENRRRRYQQSHTAATRQEQAQSNGSQIDAAYECAVELSGMHVPEHSRRRRLWYVL